MWVDTLVGIGSPYLGIVLNNSTLIYTKFMLYSLISVNKNTHKLEVIVYTNTVITATAYLCSVIEKTDCHLFLFVALDRNSRVVPVRWNSLIGVHVFKNKLK